MHESFLSVFIILIKFGRIWSSISINIFLCFLSNFWFMYINYSILPHRSFRFYQFVSLLFTFKPLIFCKFSAFFFYNVYFAVVPFLYVFIFRCYVFIHRNYICIFKNYCQFVSSLIFKLFFMLLIISLSIFVKFVIAVLKSLSSNSSFMSFLLSVILIGMDRILFFYMLITF